VAERLFRILPDLTPTPPGLPKAMPHQARHIKKKSALTVSMGNLFSYKLDSNATLWFVNFLGMGQDVCRPDWKTIRPRAFAPQRQAKALPVLKNRNTGVAIFS